jgi:hypothetical protein
MDVVNYALSIQSDYYAPQITSPKDLYYKHLKVMAYYRNNEGGKRKCGYIMNRQDILREATRKAIKNGWKGSPIIDNVKHYQKLATSKIQVDTIYGESWYELVLLYLPPHDFAKALWGKNPMWR